LLLATYCNQVDYVGTALGDSSWWKMSPSRGHMKAQTASDLKCQVMLLFHTI